MAENGVKLFYQDLSRLFRGGPVVRHRVANKIASPGQVGVPVGTARAFLKHTNVSYASTLASYGQYNRLARYSDYNEMESMAEINSALDIYSDEVCSRDEYGNIIKIESDNSQIREALELLFYDVLNIEFNAWTWIRNLCKYGDQFLMVDHHPDYGVMNVLPLPVNEMEREEGYDEENPLAYRYRWITQGNRVLDSWQIIHFRLMANDNFLPYGSSILEGARRTWRQLILMEDAVMVYRIVRSPERRVFYIDVGNVAPQDIPAYIEKVKGQLKRNQIVDSDTGRVDQRYNALSTDEDYFLPQRGAEGGSRIDTLAGGQFTGDIEDLNYIQNKLFAALKIPKSYLGYEADISSKSTLSQEDVRFARTIQRIQRVFVAELNKIAVIHLFSMGFKGNDLVNFDIGMANPSTISEIQKLELWRTKFEVASLSQDGVLDKSFVYRKIFRLSNEDIEQVEEGRRKDRMFDLEVEAMQAPQIETPPPAAPPPPESAAPPAPVEPGLPPPPGEEAGGGAPITSAKDPNKQSAAPNELIHAFPGKKPSYAMPNLKNYAFNMKKTAMDPKRSYSELGRFAKAPFGESVDEGTDIEEQVFRKNVSQLQRIAKEIENIDALRSISEKKTKKVFSD